MESIYASFSVQVSKVRGILEDIRIALVDAGVKDSKNFFEVSSFGYAGLPDRKGINYSLDLILNDIFVLQSQPDILKSLVTSDVILKKHIQSGMLTVGKDKMTIHIKL